MKKITFIFFILTLCVLHAYGQDTDSYVEIVTQPLTEIQRDSLLTNIAKNTYHIADETILQNKVGRYKVYRTSNIYNSLKLDTATGRITALQIGIDSDKKRFEYSVCDAVYPDGEIIGRYELYPTGNNYNFILIDTIFGYSYQIQWTLNDEECGRWRIW